MAEVHKSGRVAIAAYIAFLGCAALTGGSSQLGAASQPVIRLASIGLIAILVAYPGVGDPRITRRGLGFLALVAAVVAIQLVPLPPGLWSMLPGRAHYLDAAAAAGQSQPWRPINLTPDRGWNSLFALLPPVATLAAVSRLRAQHQVTILAAMVLIILASAMVGLGQVSGGGDDMLRFYAAPPTGSAVGLFANRNHQALLLCCGIPMLALWAEFGAGGLSNVRMRALLAAAAGAFLILMIPTTGSRAGLALGGLALALAIPLAWPAGRHAIRSLSRRQRSILGLGGIVLLMLLIGAALTFARAEAVRRLFEADPVADARIRLLPSLLRMIRDFFPFGSGFGSFDAVYRGYEPFENLAVTFMNQAHDDYLQVVMEAGLPGLILIVCFVAWWAVKSLQLWTRRGGEGTAFGRLGTVLLLLIMLASIADYPLRTPLMMIVAAQAAAWMLMASRRRHDRA